jgi:hypothetical protein
VRWSADQRLLLASSADGAIDLLTDMRSRLFSLVCISVCTGTVSVWDLAAVVSSSGAKAVLSFACGSAPVQAIAPCPFASFGYHRAIEFCWFSGAFGC